MVCFNCFIANRPAQHDSSVICFVRSCSASMTTEMQRLCTKSNVQKHRHVVGAGGGQEYTELLTPAAIIWAALLFVVISVCVGC